MHMQQRTSNANAHNNSNSNNSNGKVVSTFPLPKIQELLSCLNKCKYFSSLDLSSGYYHMSLTGKAKKKTAFKQALKSSSVNVSFSNLTYIT